MYAIDGLKDEKKEILLTSSISIISLTIIVTILIINYKNNNKTFDYSDFICYTSVREDLSKVMKEIMSYPQRDEYTVEELEDYITRVKECRVNMEINKLSENLKNTIDLEEKKRLATKIENMKKEVLKW